MQKTVFPVRIRSMLISTTGYMLKSVHLKADQCVVFTSCPLDSALYFSDVVQIKYHEVTVPILSCVMHFYLCPCISFLSLEKYGLLMLYIITIITDTCSRQIPCQSSEAAIIPILKSHSS